MDFFRHQDEARSASKRLVLYFGLAVIAIVLSVHLAGSFFFFWVQSSAYETFSWWSLDRLVFFAGGALLIIAAGSLYKMWRLSDGGHTVARLLGGRPISPNTTDPLERRALNVVEEMAIAAGLPVPTVYLLEQETGINAFAAGFTPQDAVIGITKGTLTLLKRDELQGVIAHEFSHIFNGDMSLNLRLMGVLHGILVIALIGYFILRASVRGSGRSSRKGGAAAVLPLAGLALVVIGYVGVFFGRLIKSAVSRQREFLADASAVQFTRNPDGVSGALKKIGGLDTGSLIMSPNAEQASHFFFSDGKLGKVRAGFSGLTHFDFLATHPPLADRIRRIEPRWDGSYPRVETPSAAELAQEPRSPGKAVAPPKVFDLLPAQLVALIGTVDQAHLSYARSLLSGIPDRVRAAVHDPAGARAVVLALLASGEASVREKQLRGLGSAKDDLLEKDVAELVPLLEKAAREIRLPLIDLALPSLRRLSPAQYQSFQEQVRSFMRADQQIDLFEYTLTHILDRHLAPTFETKRPTATQIYSLAPLRKECSILLSAVAHAGHKDPLAAGRAFTEGAKELSGIRLEFAARNDAGLASVRDALEKTARVAPKLKKELMRALVAAVAYDGKVTVGEGEVLRAISDALGLPMPPFLPGQELGSPAVP
jgi:Zn-dependent protease with chaperone function